MIRLSSDIDAVEFTIVDVRAALDGAEEAEGEALDDLPAGVCL
jgi:hypothetical protein